MSRLLNPASALRNLFLRGLLVVFGCLALAHNASAAGTTPQTITFASLTNILVGDAHILDVSASSGLPVSIELLSGPATLDGLIVAPTGPGVISLRATQAGDDTYAAAVAIVRSFTATNPPPVVPVAQTITFPVLSDIAVGYSQLLDASSDSGLPITYEVVSGEALILGFIITPTAPGPIVVRASQAGDDTYASATPVTRSFTASADPDDPVTPENPGTPTQNQVITFDTPAGLEVGDFLLIDAFSDSGLPVLLELVSGPATLTGNLLTATGAGAVTVRATQPGDSTYRAAPAVSRTFAISAVTDPGIPENPGTPTQTQSITFEPLEKTEIGTPQLLDASASSGLAVSFEIVSGSATIDGLFVTATAAGTVTVRARQTGDSTYLPAPPVDLSFEATAPDDPVDPVEPGGPRQTQTISFTQPEDMVVGDFQFLDVTSSSGLPVTLSVSGPAILDGITLIATGAGRVTITATQAGDANFFNAPTQAFFVKVSAVPTTPVDPQNPGSTPQPQEIDFPLLAPATYGDPPVYLPVSATSGLPVKISISGPATLDGDLLVLTGAGTVVITASQSGNASYRAAPTVKQTLVVAKATLLVTLDQDYLRLVGTANPPFTPSYLGFQGEDTEAKLKKRPVATTLAKASSKPGNYAVTLSGGLDANYTFDFGPPRSLTVVGFGGAYEALLLDPVTTLPVGKLELTLSASGPTYSGKFTLAREAAPVGFKGSLSLEDEANASAEVSVALRAASTVPARTYTLAFQLQADSVSAQLQLNDAPLAEGFGPILYVLPAKATAPWTGTHTLVLRKPLAPDGGSSLYPPGAGHATATIAKTGVLALKGQLADGTVLSASVRPSDEGIYRLFVLPYPKRLNSQLSGELALEPHPDLDGRFFISAEQGLLHWTKAPSPAKPLDKNYRAGFGPLEVPVTLDPWQPPAAAKKATKTTAAVDPITLVQRLGLATDPLSAGVFGIDYPDDLDFGASAGSVPLAASLSIKNAVTVPVTTPPNPTKWKAAFNASTGAFSGSFVLTDTIPAPTVKNPAATKIVSRAVAFSGVLRQPPSTETSAAIGQGFFLLPAFDKTAEQPSGEVRFEVP